MGDNLLSTEEVLLLENLMYLTDESPLNQITDYEGVTIGEMLSRIDVDKLKADEDYGSYITGEDWSNIITAIRNNETLMNMEIATTHVDTAEGGGGGVSAVFVNGQSGEAVVAFRGTGSHEWKDDFVGGGITDRPDGVSTVQQENALDWYQNVYDELGLEEYVITITGHSKGGNKAKYITILDGSVDRCISFDGQGFSDEFMEKYAELIAERQEYIENHNVDYDFVNLLLNDIGKTIYYEGYDYGKGGFLENHCPNTFFDFKDGKYVMRISKDGQAEEMQKLDEFLNSYLRSLSPEDKAEALDFIGTLVEGGFNREDKDFFLDLFFEGDNTEIVAYLLAYLIEYEQANPDFIETVSGVMEEFGMEDMLIWVDVVDYLLKDDGIGDWLIDIVDGLSEKVPDWLWDKLRKLLKDKFNIDLSKEELEKLVGLIGKMNDDMDDIKVRKGNGKDVKVPKRNNSYKNCRIKVDINCVSQCISQMEENSNKLENLLEQLEDVRGLDSIQMLGVKLKLGTIKRNVERQTKATKQMAERLGEIVKNYRDTEHRNMNSVRM